MKTKAYVLKYATTMLGLILLCSGCSIAIDAVHEATTSQKNQIRILVKQRQLSKETKLFVVFKDPRMSNLAWDKMKTEHLPYALSRAGLENYEILGRNSKKPQTNNGYLLMVNIGNWTAKETDSKSHYLWVSLDAEIYDIKTDQSSTNVIVKAAAEATDFKFVGYDIKKTIESLIAETLVKMYAPSGS